MDGILRSIKRRNVLYKRSMKNRSPDNVEKYKKYRNKLTSIIRCSRRLFYSKRFESANGNISSTWKIVKDILCKQGKHEVPGKIVHGNKEITNAEDIANAYNTYFVNVGLNQAKMINKDGTGSRTTTPWAITPGKLPPGKLPPKDNYPLEYYPPENHPPRTTTPQGKLPPGKLPPENYPPRTITPRGENYPPTITP